MAIKKKLRNLGYASLVITCFYVSIPSVSALTYEDAARAVAQKRQLEKLTEQNVTQEVQQEIDTKIEKIKKFNSGLENFVAERIQDDKLTISENREIRSYLEQIKSLVREVEFFFKYKCSEYKSVKLSKDQKASLYYDIKLEEALHAADGGFFGPTDRKKTRGLLHNYFKENAGFIPDIEVNDKFGIKVSIFGGWLLLYMIILLYKTSKGNGKREKIKN